MASDDRRCPPYDRDRAYGQSRLNHHFSGYQNFIRDIDARLHETWPLRLSAVDLTTVKQRAFGTIMVIASIDALARYLDIEKENNVRLTWVALFALMFGVPTVMLALADRIARRSQSFQSQRKAPARGETGALVGSVRHMKSPSRGARAELTMLLDVGAHRPPIQAER